MKIYLAGSENYAKMLGEDNLYKGANVLNSFFTAQKMLKTSQFHNARTFY